MRYWLFNHAEENWITDFAKLKAEISDMLSKEDDLTFATFRTGTKHFKYRTKENLIEIRENNPFYELLPCTEIKGTPSLSKIEIDTYLTKPFGSSTMGKIGYVFSMTLVSILTIGFGLFALSSLINGDFVQSLVPLTGVLISFGVFEWNRYVYNNHRKRVNQLLEEIKNKTSANKPSKKSGRKSVN